MVACRERWMVYIIHLSSAENLNCKIFLGFIQMLLVRMFCCIFLHFVNIFSNTLCNLLRKEVRVIMYCSLYIHLTHTRDSYGQNCCNWQLAGFCTRVWDFQFLLFVFIADFTQHASLQTSFPPPIMAHWWWWRHNIDGLWYSKVWGTTVCTRP